MLSNTSRYAIRALIYLAINSDKAKIGIKKIAEDLNIPSPFLGKILQTLAKQKVLDSTKGPNGGFSISKESQKTLLIDIIKIIDGDDLFDKCLVSNRTCTDMKGRPCALHSHYEEIRKKITAMFSDHSIADLAKEFSDAGGAIDI
ncbi:MAG: Rrf2 family transcriptional regulator [Bacteroidales bacterium]|nr:Rrf2 family transcriptional regulator [Bacteroidales bacterium]